MKVRADIAQLLREGLSDRAISRRLHTDSTTVSAARRALGLPKVASGYPAAASAADLFQSRTQPDGDGHLVWTGYADKDGLPCLRYAGRNLSAYRIAFRIHNGRDPVGQARPGCERPGCVAPAHIDDQPARARNRATYNALFGGTP